MDALSNAAAALKNLAVDDADNKNLIRETNGEHTSLNAFACRSYAA
jgi:hypothetical protein